MRNDRTMAASSLMTERELMEFHDGLYNGANHYPLYTACDRLFLEHLMYDPQHYEKRRFITVSMEVHY
jgi:hypothetical protein